ncbi:MAG: hypothetical protein WCL39_05705 [Armatimonadota bacterium]
MRISGARTALAALLVVGFGCAVAGPARCEYAGQLVSAVSNKLVYTIGDTIQVSSLVKNTASALTGNPWYYDAAWPSWHWYVERSWSPGTRIWDNDHYHTVLPGGTDTGVINLTATTPGSWNLTVGAQYDDPINFRNMSSSPIVIPITIGNPPTDVVATASPNPVCIGSTLTLTGTATGADSYSWSGPGYSEITLYPMPSSRTMTITSAAQAGVYTVRATNSFGGTTATTASVTVIPSEGSIAAAKLLNDGDSVTLGNKNLYLKWVEFGYIEEPEPNRFAGIRVEGAVTALRGEQVNLVGTMRKPAGAEPYIQVTQMGTNEPVSLKPYVAINRSIARSLMDGLYITTFGTVKPDSVTGNSYVITDGSDDVGITVVTEGPPTVIPGEFVVVTGAVGNNGGRVLYQTASVSH